jgi:hypothetical protein
MTQRTRYFLVGSGLFVVVGLCTGLVAYYRGDLPLGRSSAGPAELIYVPADTKGLAYADVHHIMTSQFRQRVRALLPTGQAKNQLLQETGVDVERDIDSVVAGFDGVGPGAAGHLALLRGRFAADRLEAAARQHGATFEDYRGKRLVVQPEQPGQPAQPGAEGAGQSRHAAGAFAFLEPDLIALGDVTSIKHAIDAAAGRDNITGNPEFMKFVAGVAHSGDAWVVGQFDALAGDSRVSPDVRQRLGALKWFAVSADVDQTVTCRVHAEARDAQSAADVRSAVNGMVSAARLMSNEDPRMAAVLNSIQSAGTGPEIDLVFTVPPDVLDLIGSAAHGSTTRPAAQ